MLRGSRAIALHLALVAIAIFGLSRVANAFLFTPGMFVSAGKVTEINRLTGTIVTDTLSTWANVGAGQGAFNGVGVQSNTNSSGANGNGAAPVGTNYIGKDWGAGNSRRIVKIIVSGPSDNSLLRGGVGAGAVVTATFDGSNDGTTWTTLDTFTTSGATSQVITRTTTINTTTAYRFHRVAAPGNGANGCAVAQFQLFDIE